MRIPLTSYTLGGRTASSLLCSTVCAILGLTRQQVLEEVAAGRLEASSIKKKKYGDGERAHPMMITRASLERWLASYDVRKPYLDELTDYEVLTTNDLVRLSGMTVGRIETLMDNGVIPVKKKDKRKRSWFAGEIKASHFAELCRKAQSDTERVPDPASPFIPPLLPQDAAVIYEDMRKKGALLAFVNEDSLKLYGPRDIVEQIGTIVADNKKAFVDVLLGKTLVLVDKTFFLDLLTRPAESSGVVASEIF